jgi:hypothetical protein
MARANEGNILRAVLKSGATASRSWILPGDTKNAIIRPSVSTAMCRFLPLIFLPAS